MGMVEVELHVARFLVEGWMNELVFMNRNKDGRPFKYSKGLIAFAAALKDILQVSYRSLSRILEQIVPSEKVPHFITLQQRIAKLGKGKPHVKKKFDIYKSPKSHIVYDRRGLRVLKKFKPRGDEGEFINVKIFIKPNVKRPAVKDVRRMD